MRSIITSFVCLCLPHLTTARINVTTQSFQLAGEKGISSAKLTWTLVPGAYSYNVLRLSGKTYKQVANVPGNTFDVYDIANMDTYHVVATNGSDLDSSADVNVSARTYGACTNYDNTAVSTLKIPSKLVRKGTYYAYSYVADKQGFNRISQRTSTDGYTFTGDETVLTRDEVCAGVDGGLCKMESIAFAQNPKTEQIVMWAHFENLADYTLGRVAVAYGDPGENLTFGGSFRPTGDDSRDLTFFQDPNGKGYIITAIHTNTDIGLYALNDNWTNVTSKVATLYPGENREAPAMVFDDGYYYLFTSQAAGWYPSPGKYISAKDIAGPWTASSFVGDIATFGAQSGGIIQIGNYFVMAANRWAGNWDIPEPSNRQILLPISFSNGFASYSFFDTISYDAAKGDVVPVQSGRILSVGMPATASGAKDKSSPGAANDGIQNDPDNVFVPDVVPFWWQVDLGAEHVINQVDVAVKQVGGSEVYPQYTVLGSTDNKDFSSLLVDEKNNTVVGFVTNKVNDKGTYRYIRVQVDNVKNVHNGNEADWSAGLHEVTVYGQK